MPTIDDYQKELDEYIKEHRSIKKKSASFVEYLYHLMEKHGFENASDLYNKANISRQLYSSIISEKSNPSINVCIKLAFTLKLNNNECKYLMKKAGYTLASSSKYALIIRYCIHKNIYDLSVLNDLLIKNGYTDSLID